MLVDMATEVAVLGLQAGTLALDYHFPELYFRLALSLLSHGAYFLAGYAYGYTYARRSEGRLAERRARRREAHLRLAERLARVRWGRRSPGLSSSVLTRLPAFLYQAERDSPLASCPVCLGEPGESPGPLLVRLPCSHALHAWPCAAAWFLDRATCPHCTLLVQLPAPFQAS